MDKSQYRYLGEFIEPTMEKNVGLKVRLSQGINNNKYFQNPRQVAQDSENDQIVRQGQFAYNKATTRNGEKISIAYRDGEDCTVSSAYQVFYIKDENELNPYYLMMWFKRPEFDRYARFKSHGSAHEFFTFEEMCNVLLPVPPIEEQRRIVAEYQTIERRIRNNELLIKKLEETAQAIYHHTFVEGIDPENLPEGWRNESVFGICSVIYGFPFNSELFTDDHTQIPLIRIRNIQENETDTYTSENVDKKYFIKNGDILIGMDGEFHMTLWAGGKAYQNQRTVRIVCDKLKNLSEIQVCNSIAPKIKALESSIEGTTVAHLSDKHLKELKIIIAPKDIQMIIYNQFEAIKRSTILIKRESHHLKNLLSLLTSKLS